jgi:tRNA/tmRNA/rRNA uracil-C5-methylase (TrmA/RlmC/RlmD family)
MNDTTECVIQDIAYRGRGVARIDGKAVFVPGVITDERVALRITRQHKRYAEAELVEIFDASPQRTAPFCRHYGTCPGCSYQHMTYSEELRSKHRQLQAQLRHVPGVEQTVFPPPIASPLDRRYRNRITLHRAKNNIGYIAHDNQTLIPIRDCPLAHDAINQSFAGLTQQPDVLPDRFTLRHTLHDGVLIIPDDPSSERRTLTENSALLGDLSVADTGFYQVNPALADLLLTHVQQLIRDRNPAFLLDLYCGVGVFALTAAAVLPDAKILGIETNKRAIAHAKKNAQSRHLPHVRFQAASAEDALSRLPASTSPNNQLWIVDPPRSGLQKAMIHHLLTHQPQTLIYVSCAPDTLARDLKMLCQKHYGLTQASLFDMFPRTYCFETVALLEKQPPQR